MTTPVVERDWSSRLQDAGAKAPAAPAAFGLRVAALRAGLAGGGTIHPAGWQRRCHGCAGGAAARRAVGSPARGVRYRVSRAGTAPTSFRRCGSTSARTPASRRGSLGAPNCGGAQNPGGDESCLQGAPTPLRQERSPLCWPAPLPGVHTLLTGNVQNSLSEAAQAGHSGITGHFQESGTR